MRGPCENLGFGRGDLQSDLHVKAPSVELASEQRGKGGSCVAAEGVLF